MKKKLPIYEALIEGDTIGIFKVSLVDDPATQTDFLAFANEKEPLKFKVTDEDEHRVLAVIMRADFLIYRRTDDGFEYYLKFSPETLFEASRRMLAGGYQNSINLEHKENTDIEGFELVHIFQKDSSKGINPVGFEDIEEGSLFGEYYVSNEEIWKQIKDGTFTSVSLEGIFDTVEVSEPEINSIEDLAKYLGLS